jgi:sugar transferase (PEP-CTERM/EpsH1 system associated)
VCFIIDHLAVGGAQRQLVELVRALPRDRFQLSVVSLSTAQMELAKAIAACGVEVVSIRQSGPWSWSCFWRLLHCLRRVRPDVVHTWLFTADLYGRLAARLAGVPVVVSAVRSVEPDKPWHYIAADRILGRATDGFTVNARAIGEVLIRRERIAPGKIHLVANGVDLRVFDPARVNGALRCRLGVGPEAPVVGIVGRLAPVKDHATFLRAAARVVRQAPDVRFLLVGRGPLRQDVERLAAELGLGRHVHVLDEESQMPDVFASLDIAVVSSRYEGCSNAILEAMAMAKPVIATAVGGNPELVVPDETGLLVPPQDPDRLGEAILALVQDRARAERMGRSGRRVIEARFSVQRMVEETAALFGELLERRRAGHR